MRIQATLLNKKEREIRNARIIRQKDFQPKQKKQIGCVVGQKMDKDEEKPHIPA